MNCCKSVSTGSTPITSNAPESKRVAKADASGTAEKKADFAKMLLGQLARKGGKG